MAVQGSPAGSQPAVEVEGLTKQFGLLTVLRGLDLRVAQGERLVLFGPNGAGKTTLLRILATLAKPTGGSARVLGWDVRAQADEIRTNLALVAHGHHLYDDLTASENLAFSARMAGMNGGSAALEQALKAVGLEAFADARVRTFSAGMKRRVALARLFLRRPRLVLLDEPYSGLDPDGAAVLDRFLEDHRHRGGTAILATHDHDHGYRMGERIAILAGGRIGWEARRDAVSLDAVREAYALLGRGR
jgi:heme exporter protein A